MCSTAASAKSFSPKSKSDAISPSSLHSSLNGDKLDILLKYKGDHLMGN